MISPSRRLERQAFRKKTNLAVAVLSEVTAPILRASASAIARGTPSHPDQWRECALVGAAHIGDVLYNTASLRVLRERFPKCNWHFVAPPSASEVLRNNPYLTGCSPGLGKLGRRIKLDAVICYNSAGYWRELIEAAILRIPNRVAYSHKGFSGLVTFPIAIDFPQPYPAYFRELVAQLTGRAPNWSLRPEIYPTATDEVEAKVAWDELGFDNRGPVVACFLTSRQRSGVWPAEKFADSIAHLESARPIQTVLCGTTSDEPLLKELKERFQLRSHILAGQLGLLSLGCFLRRCAVVLCPDSGPRHIANAVGTRLAFVRNIAVGKIETGKYCETEADLAPDFECVPQSDQPEIFEQLRPQAAAERVVSLLDEGSVTTPSEASRSNA